MATDFLNDYLFITVGGVGAASDLVTEEVVYGEKLPLRLHRYSVLHPSVKSTVTLHSFVQNRRVSD